MFVTGIKHYTIEAPAEVIDACVVFYRTILNLRVGFRPPLEQDGFWLYAGENALLHLLISNDEQWLATTAASIAFTCVNLPAAMKRLEESNVAYQTRHLAELDQFQIFLKDPANIPLELNFFCSNV